MAVTARDAGQLGNSDDQQLDYAVGSQRAFLTHNRVDLERLAQAYYQAGKDHYGIIIAARHSAHEVVRRLLFILNQVAADELKNQVRYI